MTNDTIPMGTLLDLMGVPDGVQTEMAKTSDGGTLTFGPGIDEVRFSPETSPESSPPVLPMNPAPSSPETRGKLDAMGMEAFIAPGGQAGLPVALVGIANVPMADLGTEEVVRALEALGENGPRPAWTIEDVGGLEWYLRKVAGIKDEIDGMKANASAQQKILNSRLKRFEDFFKPQAESFLEAELVRQRSKKSSINTLAGTVGFQFRGKDGEFEVVDQEALKAWAKESAPALVTVTMTDEFDVAELVAYAKATKPELVRQRPTEAVHTDTVTAHYRATGEIPPGCRLSQATRVMFVRAVKTEAPAETVVVSSDPWFKAQVAGTVFCKFDWALIAAGDRVSLVREPENPRDPQAIQVVHAAAGKLGYVPAKDGTAAKLSPVMDSGGHVMASIAEIKPGSITLTIRAGITGQ